MISHKHQCIFIHIPKTGGTSIEDILWPDESDRVPENLFGGYVSQYSNKYQTGGLQHLTALQVRNEVGRSTFESYYKFAIVRNPWEKAVSQFSYIRKRKYLMDFIGMTRWTTFRKYLTLISKKEHVQWKPQSDFILDEQGKLIVDKVIRFENLAEGFVEVAEQMGLGGANLSHTNKSQRRPYHSYYSTKALALVREMYADDINFFCYDFEESDSLYG